MTKETIALGLTQGKKIGNIICHKSYVFADLVVILNKQKKCKCFTKTSIQRHNPSPFLIGDENIESVFLPKNYEILILKTATQTYIRDYQNQPIEDAKNWEDFYIEPFLNIFFRKDTYGFWYDIEGYRLATPVFLQGSVLISLLGKTSKQSLSFQGQKILASPNFGLIQVGKLVFNQQLRLIDFYGERITGLGSKCIVFDNGKTIQKIQIGLDQHALWDIQTNQPFLINSEIVTTHLQTIYKEKNRFEIFETKQNKYALMAHSAEPISCDGHLVDIDFSTYTLLHQKELVKCTHGGKHKFMDIVAQVTFLLPIAQNEPIHFIDNHVIRINNEGFRNIATAKKQFVYNEDKNEIFTLHGGRVFPEKIIDIEHYENYFAIATINGVDKVFSKKTLKILDFNDKTIQLQNIISPPNQSLLNAIDTSNQKIVLDARQGLGQLELAKIDKKIVVEVLGTPESMGNSFLQNARIKTLGGTGKRVIDLSKKALSIYRLPADLKVYSENTEHSVYSNAIIHELDFEHTIMIEDEVFVTGKFIPFREDFSDIIIQKKNNRPLHLEGGSHKNELVTGFVLSTLQEHYFLEKNRMIGAHTLTESYKSKELLFSFEKKKSWLPFNDTFLPILEKIIVLNKTLEWEYLLFELRGTFSKSEFIAVEKNAPHRILVEKKRDEEIPKILKGTDTLPNTPGQISWYQKLFFKNAGYLKDME